MPTSTYRCDNRECSHFGADRVVTAVEVGDGLHSSPSNVTCVCGYLPRQVSRDRFACTEAPAPPEKAVRRQPEKRRRG